MGGQVETIVGNRSTNAFIREFAGFIETAANKTYVICGSAVTAGTINSAWLEMASGTLTVAIKINGTNVTGLSAVSVTSTGATTSASAANTFAAGDKITMVVSAVASPVDFDFTIKWTVT